VSNLEEEGQSQLKQVDFAPNRKNQYPSKTEEFVDPFAAVEPDYSNLNNIHAWRDRNLIEILTHRWLNPFINYSTKTKQVQPD
jgi:hypothetical protein